MTVHVGTAYVDIKPDWTGFHRGITRESPAVNRSAAKLGGEMAGNLVRNFSGVGSRIGRELTRGVGIGAKGALAGTVVAMAAAEKKAIDFEAQLSSLGSVADANAKQMEALSKAAIKAGADTKYSALEAAQAQTELAKGGLSVEQIMGGGLNAALALAAAGELELADAAATTVNSMKLFGLTGRQSMKVADALATAANSTTADVSDFSLALNQVGSAGKTVGLSFTETITALETLAETGIKGSDAGTSLKTALIQLASPSSNKAVEMTEKLGINVFDAKGNMKDLADVSKELQDGLGDLTAEQRINAATTLVGQDGFRALLALYDAGPSKIRKLEGELNKQGSAAEVAKKKQDNLKGSLEQLGGGLETLGIQVGTAAIPAIRTISDELVDFTGDLSKIVARDDLDVGEKLSESLKLAKVDAKPWIDRLEREIIAADLPGDIARLMERGTDRIGSGFNGGAFSDQLMDQVRDADLPEKFGELISEIAPKIGQAVASAAVLGAGAFVNAFLGADVWGKLALGAWLLSKMGGPSTFRKIGVTAGTNFNAGAAASGGMAAIAVAGATGGVGGGKTSKLPKQPALLRPTGGDPLAGATTGLAHGSPLIDTGAKQGLVGPTAGQRARSAGQSAKSAVKGGAGALPIIGAGVFTVIALNEDAEVRKAEANGKILANVQKELEASLPSPRRWQEASDALDVLNQNFGGSVPEYEAAGDALERLGLKLDATPEQVKSATDAFADLKQRFEVTQRLLAKGISLPSEVTEADGAKIANSIERMADGATTSIRNLRTNVRLNTRQIKATMGEDSLEGRQAMSANFRAAAENVERSMKAGQIATKEGTAEIRRLMVKSLGQFGFSEKQALNIIETGDDQGNKGREGGAFRKQRGGVLTGGLPTGDSIPVLAERGEYVVNREAVKKIGVRALDRLNFGAAPRFQTGGIVELLHPFNDPAGHGGSNSHLHIAASTVAAIVALGRRLQSMGWLVSEQSAFGGVHGGHAAGGYHPRDQAIDVNWPDPGQEAEKIRALLPMLQSGQVSLEAPQIKRLLVGGPDSPLKTIVQSVVDTARSAAQSVVDSTAGTGFEGAEVAAGGASGNGANLMRSIAKQRGWKFEDWWALDAKETGHGANLSNPTSTARLRGQFLDFNYGKYGPGSDPGQNPSVAQQIQAMAAYIAERYGNPTKALAFHNAHNFYQQGGLVGLVKGGLLDNKAGLIKGKARFGGIDLGGVLKRIRTGKSQKLRDEALKGLLAGVKGIQFDETAGTLSRLAGDVDLFGDYADRAGQLTDSSAITDALQDEMTRRGGGAFPADEQQAIVNQLLGRVNGGTQLEWLSRQITSMFDWRNVLVDTAPIVQQLRDQTAGLLEKAQTRLNALVAEIEATQKEIDKLVREREKVTNRKEVLEGRIEDEMDKPAKKRDQKKLGAWRAELADKHARHVEINARLSAMRAVQRGRDREREALDSDTGIVASLTEKRDSLATSYEDIAQNITTVQGIGGPMSRLGSLPAIGALGGKLFDTQKLIADLTNNPPRVEATVAKQNDGDQQSASILRDLLNEANLRTTVSERTFDVFKQFDLPPYGGSFLTGGTVPGPVGAARTIIAHGGEEVVPVGGDGPKVRVIVEDNRVRVFVDDIEQAVETVTRRQARGARRALPGIGGGRIG